MESASKLRYTLTQEAARPAPQAALAGGGAGVPGVVRFECANLSTWRFGLIRRILLFAVVGGVLVSTSCVTRPTPFDNARVTDPKSYGDCIVQTEVDNFSDKMRHGIVCASEADTILGFYCEQRKKLGMFHVAGERALLEGTSHAIRFRFDNGEIHDVSSLSAWIWVGDEFETARTSDVAILHELITEFAAAKTSVAFEVTSHVGRVDLSDSNPAAAVADYKSRCSQL